MNLNDCPSELTVPFIVATWLRQHGFDGLVNTDLECGCREHVETAREAIYQLDQHGPFAGASARTVGRARKLLNMAVIDAGGSMRLGR